MKLSFKKEKAETGLSGVGRPYPNTQIKGDKLVVGFIYAPTWQTKDSKWSIGFSIKNEADDGGFDWIKLKVRFDSEAEARFYVTEKWKLINETYDLFQFDKGTFE